MTLLRDLSVLALGAGLAMWLRQNGPSLSTYYVEGGGVTQICVHVTTDDGHSRAVEYRSETQREF